MRAYEGRALRSIPARPAQPETGLPHHRDGGSGAGRSGAEAGGRRAEPAAASAGRRAAHLALGSAAPRRCAATARALSLDPANVAATAEHARLLGRIGRNEELAEALGSLGRALADPIDKAAAYRLQAEIIEWQLGDKRAALAAVERAAAAMSAERHGRRHDPIALQRLYQLVRRGAGAAAGSPG